MTKHVVVGAGPVGSAVARQLVERGEEVVLASRSGSAAGGRPLIAWRRASTAPRAPRRKGPRPRSSPRR